MIVLWLSQNQLTGPIPTEIERLTKLDDFRIHSNSISGDIPEELWSTGLSLADMFNCNLTGTLSDKIGRLSLETLRLSNNHLTGTIPESLAAASFADQIWLNGNDLSGSMPERVCQLRGENTLVSLQADCLPDAVTKSVELNCDASCCTLCCDPEGTLCLETEP